LNVRGCHDVIGRTGTIKASHRVSTSRLQRTGTVRSSGVQGPVRLPDGDGVRRVGRPCAAAASLPEKLAMLAQARSYKHGKSPIVPSFVRLSISPPGNAHLGRMRSYFQVPPGPASTVFVWPRRTAGVPGASGTSLLCSAAVGLPRASIAKYSTSILGPDVSLVPGGRPPKKQRETTGLTQRGLEAARRTRAVQGWDSADVRRRFDRGGGERVGATDAGPGRQTAPPWAAPMTSALRRGRRPRLLAPPVSRSVFSVPPCSVTRRFRVTASGLCALALSRFLDKGGLTLAFHLGPT